MKKITILALHLGYGGIEKYISSLCKMLDNEYEIEIICTYKNAQVAFDFSDRVKINYLINKLPSKKELKIAIRRLNVFKALKLFIVNINILISKKVKNIKAIKNINSDYIITTRIFHNRLVNKYAKKEIIKIASEHSYYTDNKEVEKIVDSVSNFNYFIAISKNLDELFRSKLNIDSVYIPNVLDLIPSNSSNLNNKSLVAIGRLSYVKGFNSLLYVIKQVKIKIPDIKLDLVGDGELYTELADLIKEYDLTDNVVMHGFLATDRVNELIKNSSLYVMTSYSESFGLVLLEAMSFGVPCIAFDSAMGARELISGNGILIKNRNLDMMANEIVYLLNNRKELNRLGMISKEFCKNYDLQNVKKQWIELLERK